jgi:predicted PurR-regulated permease PerM
MPHGTAGFYYTRRSIISMTSQSPEAAASEMIEPAHDTGRVAISKLGSRSGLRAYVLLAVTVGGLLICGLLILPFMPAVTWAIALTILFAPAHRWIEERLRYPNFAAAVSVFWIALIIVLPATLLAQRLVTEAARGVAAIKDKLTSGGWREVIDGNKTLTTFAEWTEQLDIPGVVASVSSWMASVSGSVVRGGTLQLITLLLTFYLLFYFLRDRRIILEWLRGISPLSHAEMDQLFARVDDTVKATIYGTIVVASLQGTLGGLIFWWLGLPAPLLWGLVMGMLSVVPVLGAFLIWIPAAIYLAVDGNWGAAAILSAWGVVAVGGIDNLLYPILVGDRLKLHTVPAFLSIVGGLILFGASGIILGPLTMALTVFLLEVWRVHIRRDGPDSCPRLGADLRT